MRKLGKRQTACLRSLRDNGPYPGGWVYGSHGATRRILDSLAKRGLVDRLIGGTLYRYTINDAGRKVLET
jgi:DNA-binding PadR family transcriptional regulator